MSALIKTHRLRPALGLAGALALGATSASQAATLNTQAATSANWAGYAVTSASPGTDEQFSRVSGSWVQPSADCSAGDGQSAFWVGLGGADQQSQTLEQIGTEANCGGGQATDYAWYELVPSAPVRLGLAIAAGDHISATVGVSGSAVTISMTDHTSGASTTKTLQMSSPDVSSAEWIAEAPSACNSDLSACQPVTLANFGTVAFSNASASAGGHTGTISDAQWSAQPTQLAAGGGPGFTAQGGQSSPGAAPSTLSSDGSSFSVSTQSSAASAAGGSQSGGGFAGGYPGGSYGYGGDPGSGYGYGYGYGGYGSGSGGYGYDGGYGYGGY